MMVFTSKINISNIENLINNKTFEEIKEFFKDTNIDIREVKDDDDLNSLYLLVLKRDLIGENEYENECNGLILEKETNKIVCMCQNKFRQIKEENEIKEIENNLKEHKKDYHIEFCEDGTVIRLYYYKNKWRTATTRCIDAKKSYWSSKMNFDEMFWSIFNKDTFETLHEDYTYQFILKHSENRIVVKHIKNDLIFINRINNITKYETQGPCNRRINNIQSHMQSHLEDYYLPNKRGIVIKYMNQDHTYTYLQYDFKYYYDIKNIRGNTPLIRMRYLELLNEPEKLKLLEDYYPEQLLEFAMIKHCLMNLYKNIHKLYIDSHIKHSILITDNHKFYRTLKQLHGYYKKTGSIITLEEVTKKVNSLDKNVIKKLIGWI